jgi:hypothetical protein
MGQSEYETTPAPFIRTEGITRSPTAFVSRTQGTVDERDRAALEDNAAACESPRQQRIAARRRLSFVLSGSLWRATEP